MYVSRALQQLHHQRDRAGNLLKPKSATSVSAMPLISVRRVVRAACRPAAWRRASLEGARALAEAVAALTELTMRATSEVTALAAVLLSLALEEALMVERVDSELDINEVFYMQEDWGGTYGYWLLGRQLQH